MREIFEILLNNPLTYLFESVGLSNDLSKAISGALITFLVGLLIKIFKNLVIRRKNAKAAIDLHPFFSYLKVKEARKYFIQTQYQNASPTREDEPDFSHKYVAKNPLISFFLNIAFNEKKESNKFYLVLADSGMGKTTLMINLFVRYNSFFNWRKKYQIRLFPLGDNRVLDKIKQIDPDKAKNTILLLDAFDEDPYLIPQKGKDSLTDEQSFRKRLDEIIDVVQDFREVVITSRTQYFPEQEERPYELKVPRFDGEGYHQLCKLYISPFDKTEIRQYLNKKYGIFKFWNLSKKCYAKQIVENSPKLMVRPMLLSYIDDLVKIEHNFKYSFQIYETLIEKWLEREAKRKHLGERDIFKKNLYSYSLQTALAIYNNHKINKSLYLSKEKAIEVSRENNINLEDYEITGQSLLTRDAECNCKFAHKSILEYFLAKEAIENNEFKKQRPFIGMEMAELFYRDMKHDMIIDKITITSLISEPKTNELKDGKYRELRDIIEQEEREKNIYNIAKKINSKRHISLQKLDVFVDQRDGEKYQTIKIGEQIWMANNFAYMPYVSADMHGEIWVYGCDDVCINEDKAIVNYALYGCLYNWETAKNICPPGWHLPTKEEFEILLKNLGDISKETYNNLVANGTLGINALFGGRRSINGCFFDINYLAGFWTSSQVNIDNTACCLYINRHELNVNFCNHSKNCGFSVRYIRD